MTTYKEIFGKPVKQLSTDPTDAQAEGQVWYNTTSGTFKTVVGVGAWSAGANMPEGNYGAGSCGAQTAFLYFGGAPYPGKTNATREYDGSNWTTTGNFTSTRSYLGGCGTQTAALGAGGYGPNTTASAEYDGSTWTAGNSMSQQRMNTGSTFVGIQTAALLTGGDQYSSTPRSLSVCEEYDGTNYSSGGAYPVVIQNTAQGGTQTAGWAAGGLSDPAPGTPNTVQSITNEYNGTAWTAGGALPTATFRAGGAGTQTAGLFFAGTTNGSTNLVTSFKYDGSSWTATPSMATARQSIGAGGVSSPSTAAIGAGGYVSPGVTAATEEFSLTIYSPIAATWASGGNVNTARAGSTGFGTQTAAIAANGDTYPPATGRYGNAAEEYNGATWTNIASTNTSTNFGGSSKLSPASAGSVFGGEPVSARHEYWDGSSWSEQTDMNTPGYAVGGAGTQTSSLAMAGAGRPTSTESWDGSSWTNESAVPFATFNTPGAGSQTAAIIFGGNGPSGLNTTAEYNSGTWTAGGNLISPKTNQGGAGTQTAALSFMGAFPTTASAVTTTEGYDGSAWSTRPSAATARRTLGSAGTSTAALGFAGYIPGSGKTAATEEFTGEIVQLGYKTLTSS